MTEGSLQHADVHTLLRALKAEIRVLTKRNHDLEHLQEEIRPLYERNMDLQAQIRLLIERNMDLQHEIDRLMAGQEQPPIGVL